MSLEGRTPLLLAFGEHPAECGGIRYGADRKFFRSAIVPYLEEHVLKRGQRAAVIFEYNVGFDLAGYVRNNPEHEKAVEEIVTRYWGIAANELLPSLNRGVWPIKPTDWFDWGYLDRVISINAGRPNSVICALEPLGANTAWDMYEQSGKSGALRFAGTFLEKVEVEMEILRYSARICVERSRRVARLAQAIRRQDPDAAIIIPRGYAHSGMTAFTSQEEFDITFMAHMRGAPRFSSDMIIESFRRDVGAEEQKRYAALSLHFSSYCTANAERFLREACRGGQYDEDSLRMLSVEARRYALGLEENGMLYSEKTIVPSP